MNKYNKNYTLLQNNLLDFIKNISGNAIKILLILKFHSNANNEPVYPSQERLSMLSGLSLKTVNTCISELVDKNIISIKKNNKNNVYYFNELYFNKNNNNNENDSHVQNLHVKNNSHVQNLHVKNDSHVQNLHVKNDAKKNINLQDKNINNNDIDNSILNKYTLKNLHTNNRTIYNTSTSNILFTSNINLSKETTTTGNVVVFFDEECFKKLKSYGISDKQAMELIKTEYRGFNELFIHVDNNINILKNPSGFIIKAVKDNYEFANIKRDIEKKKKIEQISKKVKDKENQEKLEKQEKSNKLNDIYNKLTEIEKSNMELEIDNEIRNNFGEEKLNSELYRIWARNKLLEKKLQKN